MSPYSKSKERKTLLGDIFICLLVVIIVSQAVVIVSVLAVSFVHWQLAFSVEAYLISSRASLFLMLVITIAFFFSPDEADADK